MRRATALVATLAVLAVTGCRDDRTAAANDPEGWQDWPVEQVDREAPVAMPPAAPDPASGSSAGMEPGALEPGSWIDRDGLPGRAEAGDARAVEPAGQTGSSPGISGGNYGRSTAIIGSGDSFSPASERGPAMERGRAEVPRRPPTDRIEGGRDQRDPVIGTPAAEGGGSGWGRSWYDGRSGATPGTPGGVVDGPTSGGGTGTPTSGGGAGGGSSSGTGTPTSGQGAGGGAADTSGGG